jgi:hypothetical protein
MGGVLIRKFSANGARTFIVGLGPPVPFRVVNGPIVIYACWEEIWRAFLRL